MNNNIIQIKNSNLNWPSELIDHSKKKNTLNKNKYLYDIFPLYH